MRDKKGVLLLLFASACRERHCPIAAEPTDEEVDELISQADKNSDGTVNKKEFMNVIRAWYLMENEKGKSSGCCVVM